MRHELARARAYVPPEGNFHLRLDANEAPDLWSARARERFGELARSAELNRYPDATCAELRRAVAARYGGSPDEYVMGAGSDELIAVLLSALGRARAPAAAPRVVTPAPTFVMYRVSSLVRGLEIVEVPTDEAWGCSAEALVEAIGRADPHVVFLATPNNPTGRALEPAALRAVVEAAPDALVVVDEAYGPYADGGFGDWPARHPNVALLGTLSKVGLAALRVGWLRGRPELARELDKMRPPYNVPSLSQRLAVAALDEFPDELARVVATVRAERDALSRGLAALGFVVTPSQANFVWAKAPLPAAELCGKLATRGVSVRHFPSGGEALRDYVRVTVGTSSEHDVLFQTLRQVLAESSARRSG
ncbi:MAG TPA: aminotransferase class I/II-fold pyridoxal phosphate-dependent enzyme [Polyangiaceae bacterium]|nr:aminotransferase class I/II-fold pyridoxal phosphate-dependent enzyme [Polyangiaceae bacterium]